MQKVWNVALHITVHCSIISKIIFVSLFPVVRYETRKEGEFFCLKEVPIHSMWKCNSLFI